MELVAPSRWACVDFISDIHLQASDGLTFQAWRDYLLHTTADAVFILGDLFEVWVGDDILLSPEGGFEQQCADVLRAASGRMDIYILCGNRDFLMGSALMAACGCTLLPEPCILSFANVRWLLVHGDAQCLDDTDYMQFRAQVRKPEWQRDFLAKPLADRMAIARGIRAQSEARKRSDTVYADVDFQAANDLLDSTHARYLVHGHTHRPAKHRLNVGRERLVLSDWDLSAQPPRAEVLRLRLASVKNTTERFTLERIPPSMAVGPHEN
ncbi:UDP-2,3-diacylglucosamine diphosphatase [Rhodoferax sp. AJA081-3]|uniref:UDP-2,3-diacylglucosamine diphosphatase n=1 Tax=Rhodoferax sp. AJA081-3 TaxID=2752316 RepID=UPI001ADED2EE|nr:UDP-2,3-diacylglucosamine diphosphatase [Rhodoferax sp. AJA081-3]QTN29275.1 UDP-2,3-diacylglucosamine diphosphatase [Rhodoferax sp. AJA081-3]